MNDPRFRTANGVEITQGLKCWDYNLRLCSVDVDASRVDEEWWDGWFRTRTPEGRQADRFNGERLCTVHPMTRQRAEDAWPA
ncbi:hypothetical protein ACIA8K_12740 [Catenuloplanes sp. NPDC051500]|uniref:hypothetical protein n=1 Tax=Catenuloplanes sp. NPDC051500 TaxID=3363959 RepID=UPI00379C49F8